MNDKQKRNIVSLYIPKHLTKKGYNHSILLYPFWGVKEKASTPITTAIFRQHNFDSAYYSITDDPTVADYIFLPYSYWFLLKKDPQLITSYVCESQRVRKPLLIDAIGDTMKDIDIPNSVVLRYSQYRNRLKDNDIIIPLYAEDLLASYRNGEISIRNKKECPSIGFVGWSSLPFFKYPRTRIKDLPVLLLGLFTTRFDLYRKGVLLRKKALKILELSSNINTHFIYRKSFSANTKTAEGDIDVLRKEFIKNILDSDYTLCVKGDANQSVRFFETLSLGRIPLFVDTDIVLPLENMIPYKDFCVFAGYRNLKSISQILTDFHSAVSPEKFEKMQHLARNVFEKYLCIDTFTKYLMEELKNKADKHFTWQKSNL